MLKRLIAGVPFDLRDVCVFGGIALAAYGAALLLPAAGYIVGGAALFYVGMWGR